MNKTKEIPFIFNSLKLIIVLIIFLCVFNTHARDLKDSLIGKINSSQHDTARCRLMISLGITYESLNQDSSLFWFYKAKEICESQAALSNVLKYYQAQILQHIAWIKSNYFGEFDESEKLSLNAISLGKGIIKAEAKGSLAVKAKKLLAGCYNNIGIVYNAKGNYKVAIEYYLMSLKIAEELGDKAAIASCYGNIGVIHFYQRSYEKTLECYGKALKIYNETGDKRRVALCYNNSGAVYRNMALDSKDGRLRSEYYLKAVENYSTAERVYYEIGYMKGAAQCWSNIGNIYSDNGSFNTANEYYKKSLKIYRESGDKNGEALTLGDLCYLFIEMADSAGRDLSKRNAILKEAVQYGEASLKIARELKQLYVENSSVSSLVIVYKRLGDYKKAVEYSELFIELQDSLFKQDKTNSIAEAEQKFETEKKQFQIEKLSKEKELQQSELLIQEALNDRKKSIVFVVIAGIVMVFVFAVIIAKRLKLTRKQKSIIEEQKLVVDEKNNRLKLQNEKITKQKAEIINQCEEIAAQRDMVVEQKLVIETQKQEITDSINYASRIQKAILNKADITNIDNSAQRFFKNCFLIFRPKEIVSGDFFWSHRFGSFLFVAVGESKSCGVPGAFLGILATNFLNEIVKKNHICNPSEVARILKSNVANASIEKHDINTSNVFEDQVSFTLCLFNFETHTLEYSGSGMYMKQNGASALMHFKESDETAENKIDFSHGDVFYFLTSGLEKILVGLHQLSYTNYQNVNQLLEALHATNFSVQEEVICNEIDRIMKFTNQAFDITVLAYEM